MPRHPETTNHIRAKLAALNPYCDLQAAFVHVAHLATEALGVAAELENIPGIESGQMQLVIRFWYSLADFARIAALACVGGNQRRA